jgi:porin
VILSAGSGPSLAQQGSAVAGPSSVPAQIRADQEARAPADLASQPWYERLRKAMDALERDHGLVLGTDYNVLYQRASRGPAQRDAAGNVFRVYGRWSPFDAEASDAGSLVFKGEYRGRLDTPIAPQALGPTVGYAGLTAVTYSNAGGVLTNFYWTQHLADNRFGFNVGVVDVTDYLDVYGLVNVWTNFNNLSFTTNPTIAAPNQGLGAAARWNFTPNWYVVAGLADANGDPHDPGGFFNSFFDVGEYFYHAEVGWVASYEQRYSDNVHVSAWQQDPRKAAGVDRGRGVTFSASRTLNERWMPFFRAGYSDGGGALVDRAVSAGLGYQLRGSDDFVGFGAGWSRAPGRDENQYSLEAYYRWQPFKHLQVVPDVQYIVNPVNARSTNSLWVLGMKLRAAF